jgi:hypothetical protein
VTRSCHLFRCTRHPFAVDVGEDDGRTLASERLGEGAAESMAPPVTSATSP